MKKKILSAIMVTAMFFSFYAGTAAYAADRFQAAIAYAGAGYEAGRMSKLINTSHAYVEVTACTDHTKSTNYIICEVGSGTKLTYDMVISNSDRTQHMPQYMSQYHNYSGITALRVNSVQGVANYTIYGKWNPNG